VRGGKFDAAEGQIRSRNVVIEFPDYATALACYRSVAFTPHRTGIKPSVACSNPLLPVSISFLIYGQQR
jgi:uncharacterized protein (DUF1330 family)